MTLWTAAHQASLSITNSQRFLKLMSIESVMPSNQLILCLPLLLLPSIFPSLRVFSNEPALRMRWPKYWSFSFSISPSNKYSGLISFRMDWLDLPAVQGTLKSLFQHHGSKASTLWRSAFLMVRLSHPYMTMEKPQLSLYGPLSVKQCLCFLICHNGTHSSTHAWRIPRTEEPGGLQSVGLQRVGHDFTFTFTFMHWRRKWQPTPVFLPGESQGQGSLVGCHLWGCTESDTTEVT